MKTIVAGAACFLLGLAAGWFISANAATSAPTSNVSTAEPGPVASAPKSSTQPKQTSDQTTPSFEDALLNFPVEVPSGRGEITGTVKTREGRAVSGATIIAHGIAMEAPVGRIAPTLQQEVEALVRRRRFAELTEARATTDSQGRYKLSVAVGVKYTARGEHDRYNLYAQAENAQAGETLDFVASPIVRVTFAVRAPDGSTPKRAHLLINWPGVESEPLVLEWYADAPVLRMYPERVSIRAQDWDESETRSGAVEITLEENIDPAQIVLVMHSIPGIKGRVISTKVDQAPSFEVACALLKNEPKSAIAWRGAKNSKSVRLTEPKGADYSFTLSNLEPGEYVVVALRQNRIVARFTVMVDNRLLVHDLLIPVPDRSDIVVVHAFGPGGESLEGLQFYDCRIYEKSQSYQHVDAVTQPDGSTWVFTYATSDAYGAGFRYFLRADSPNFGTREAEYSPSDNAEVTIRFTEPATLSLKFSDGIEFDPTKLAVSLERTSNLDESLRWTSSGRGSGGVWTFGPLSPGAYIASIKLAFGERPERVLGTQLIQVSSGKNEFSLGLPPLYSLTVKLPEAKAGQEASLYPCVRYIQWSMDEESDERGYVTFRSVPAGRYRISSNGEGMIYELSASGEIDFKAVKFNALRIELLSDKGSFAAAGLRTGDLIIGASGTMFSDGRQMQKILSVIELDKPVKLTISRQGSEFEVEIATGRAYCYESGAWLEDCPR